MPKPFAISLKLPFVEAIAQAAGRGVTLPDDYYGRLPAAARSQAFTVSGLTSFEQLQDVVDSLAGALRSGRTFEDWQLTVADDLGMLSTARQELIFRNAVQTGYGIGRTTQQRENQAQRPFYMWDAINDGRTRPGHAAMDGYIAPMSDEIWQVWSPPAGHNCRCTRISLTEAQAKARGYGTQTKPNAQPDEGWGYEKADHQGDALKTLLAKRAAVAPPAVQAAVQTIAAPVPVPHGTPVSDALTLPAGASAAADDLRQAMAAIDSVHGDGKLPPIPVELSVSRPKHLGEYGHMWDKAVGIGINPKRTKDTHWSFTFAHEVGHFLDHKGWGGPGFSSGTEAAAKVWLDAVKASPEVQRLAELHRDQPRVKYYKYALNKNELWARSYAQWIAVRSGDKKMLETLTKIKTDAIREGYRMSQWGAIEFEPIAKAIDDLFAMLGWRHP